MLTKEYAKRNLIDQINLQLGITIKHLSVHVTFLPKQQTKSKEMGKSTKIHDSRLSDSIIEKLSPGNVLKEKQQKETGIHDELIQLEDLSLIHI